MVLMLGFCELGDTADRPRGGIKFASLCIDEYLTGPQMQEWIRTGDEPAIVRDFPLATRRLIREEVRRIRNVADLDELAMASRLAAAKGKSWSDLKESKRKEFRETAQLRFQQVDDRRILLEETGYYPVIGGVGGASPRFFKSNAVVVLDVPMRFFNDFNIKQAASATDTEIPVINAYGVDLDDARFSVETHAMWASEDQCAQPPHVRPNWNPDWAIKRNELIDLDTPENRERVRREGEPGRRKEWERKRRTDVER